MKPTTEFYDLFQNIFDYFNEHLYGNELPNCMIVITRKRNVFGYYAKGRWINSTNVKTDELAINPQFFNKHPLIEILQTMAHEMCHLWQEHFGNPSRRTYHNKEWGDKMEAIGLMPSNTGKEGGKKTGQQMMEYVIEGGLFEHTCNNLIETSFFTKLWFDISLSLGVKEISVPEVLHEIVAVEMDLDTDMETVLPDPPRPSSKIKYQCPECKTNVWGKPDLNIVCGVCSTDFETVEIA